MKNKEILKIVAGVLAFVLIAQLTFLIVVNVTRREISFTLTYTLYGEEIVISGTAICKCQGFELTNESDGLVKKYKIYFPNEDIKVIYDEALVIPLLDFSAEDTTGEFGYQVLDVFFSGGNGSYYMEEDYNTWDCPQDMSWVEFSYINEEGEVAYSGFPADLAEEVFGIRLINFEYEIK